MDSFLRYDAVARPEVWTGQGGGTMELTRNTAFGYTNGVTATFATSGPAFSPNDDVQVGHCRYVSMHK